MKYIYINGNVITQDIKNAKAEAFVIENNIFTHVGSNEEILEFKTESDMVTDLLGKTVLPGFNDSHMHLLNYGYSLTKIDCNGLCSIDEIIEVSKKYIKENNIAAGTWIQGRGWNEVYLKENRSLTKHDLDKISTEHPILFTRVCEHIVAVNSKALEIAGIKENIPNPDGGEIERDAEGNLTGILKETARYLAYEIIPEKSIEDIKDMLVEAIKIASSYGVTSAQTDDFETFSDKNWKKVITAYEEILSEGRLNIRIYEQCLLPEINKLKDFISQGNYSGKGNEYFKIGPIKLLTDGSLGGRTAYLSIPYNDCPSTKGISVFTQEELDELVITAHTNNMRVVCHAIGDGAMRMVLKSYEKAQKEKLDDNARMGIIHVQITDKEIIEKFKEQNILAYIEPVCLNSDLHIAEDRIGKELLNTSYNYRTFCDEGIITPMSSDCPVDSLNPIDSMYIGVNRKDYSGYPEGGWMPEQNLSVEQMIRGFTMQSAYASFEENIKGSIEDGKLADFIIMSDDITTVNPNELRNVYVEETYLGGKCIFKKYKK